MYLPLHSITLAGRQIKYRIQGDGPEALLIHGWASSSRMWRGLMADLAGHWRCVALDLPGCGESDKPEDDWYSIPGYVQLVQQFVAALELQQPAVVGHSMGGMIAIALAAAAPALPGSLIALNPLVTGRLYAIDLRWFNNLRWGSAVMQLGQWFWPAAAWATAWLGDNRASRLRRQWEEWRENTPVSLAATARAIGQCDLTAVLPTITTPTLIALGSRDLTAPNAEGRLAARRIPGAALAVLPAGHLLTDDRPAEAAALINSFLLRNLKSPVHHRDTEFTEI